MAPRGHSGAIQQTLGDHQEAIGRHSRGTQEALKWSSGGHQEVSSEAALTELKAERRVERERVGVGQCRDGRERACWVDGREGLPCLPSVLRKCLGGAQEVHRKHSGGLQAGGSSTAAPA